MLLEGRGWMKYAIKIFGAKIQDKLYIGKYYLYAAYTEIFLEFDTEEAMLKCKNGMKEYDEYWNYDPVIEINTNNQRDRELYSKFF